MTYTKRMKAYDRFAALKAKVLTALRDEEEPLSAESLARRLEITAEEAAWHLLALEIVELVQKHDIADESATATYTITPIGLKLLTA